MDHALDRLAFDPTTSMHHAPLAPIPWPNDVRPRGRPTYAGLPPAADLSKADAVIVTWTAAEWRALTDVLDPDGRDEDYVPADFASYLPDLTDRSPARNAGCLARLRVVEGNGRMALLVHSMLHLATDGPVLPLRRFVDSLIEGTGCDRLITTGTAGGIGADAELGDVVVGSACRFFCRKAFADAPFAGKSYPTMYGSLDTAIVVKDWLDDGKLIGANIGRLDPVRTTPWRIVENEIVTTDFFAFDASDDHFGLRAFAPELHLDGGGTFSAVEMDDAVFGLVVDDRLAAAKSVPRWAAIRNVSDPQANVARYATFEDAASDMGATYRRWGYWTTVPSAIVSWLVAVA